MIKTTRVRLFEDAHRGSGNFEKKSQVDAWLRKNLGPCGSQPDRRWFFRYNRKKLNGTDRWGNMVLNDPTVFHLDVYFRNPADATFFRLKWL
jgi:hypothetical protein